MSQEEIERAIQFLLDNQAQHDVRLARLENAVMEMAQAQKELAQGQNDLRALIEELRDGVTRLIGIAEQTMTEVRQLAETQAHVIKHVQVLEERVTGRERK